MNKQIAKHEKIIKQFGRALCREAFEMHDSGEGGFTVGLYLDIMTKDGAVNVRRADNLIDAGRYLADLRKSAAQAA
jgi:hypothetical protein